MKKHGVRGYAGKVVLVTGGGAGLGAAFSRVLAASGARVVVADVRGDKAAEIAEAIGGESAVLDVKVPDEIARTFEAVRAKYGSLDVVINNAGITAGGEPLELSWSDWTSVIQVNLLGVIAGSLAALRIMKEQGSGTILNMGSINGLALTPMLGVVFFTRGLAVEAKAWGVQVSVGCPGNIRTSLLPAHVSGLMSPIDPDYAACRMLTALQRGRRVIVFPFYARLWWWLERAHTELLGPFRQVIVKRARARSDVARHTTEVSNQ